jgi:hypothetical protein
MSTPDDDRGKMGPEERQQKQAEARAVINNFMAREILDKGIEPAIAELQAKGGWPEMADWLRAFYKYEMSGHGDEGRARHTIAERLRMTPEEYEQKYAELRERFVGAIARPEMADWLRKSFNHEMSKHGDDARARHTTAQRLLLPIPPEYRLLASEQREADNRAIVMSAIARAIPVPSPVPTRVKALQAIIGCAAGAGIGLATTYALIGFFWFLVELTGATRVRVRVVGVLVVFAAPIIGAVVGAAVGWNFDTRSAVRRLQAFLDNASLRDRAWIAWGAVWTGVIVIAFTLFDPLGRYAFRYWQPNDLLSLAVVWIGPIIGGWIVTRLLAWVASGRRND